MPSPNCRKCQGKGEHPHCEGCTEWVTCDCSVNDAPPATTDEREIASFVEDLLREGRALPLRTGFEIAYLPEERGEPYVIREGSVIHEAEYSLADIMKCAKNYRYWCNQLDDELHPRKVRLQHPDLDPLKSFRDRASGYRSGSDRRVVRLLPSDR